MTGEGGNVAAYVTSEGVVLVDDMFERNADDILGVVRSVTDKPVRYVLNTHQHSDHAGGNARIPPVVEIIAHENARANMAALKQPGLPRVTFSQETAVFLGGKEVLAAYYGRGHTGGDAVVYFPDLKVIHTGDLFLSGPVIPRRQGGANIYIDYAQGGSAVEWTDALGRILTLDFDTVIPGHGPLATRADVVTFRADFAAMRGRVVRPRAPGQEQGRCLENADRRLWLAGRRARDSAGGRVHRRDSAMDWPGRPGVAGGQRPGATSLSPTALPAHLPTCPNRPSNTGRDFPTLIRPASASFERKISCRWASSIRSPSSSEAAAPSSMSRAARRTAIGAFVPTAFIAAASRSSPWASARPVRICSTSFESKNVASGRCDGGTGSGSTFAGDA